MISAIQKKTIAGKILFWKIEYAFDLSLRINNKLLVEYFWKLEQFQEWERRLLICIKMNWCDQPDVLAIAFSECKIIK